tara:strand:+ start:468 stop:623 length:156 start_codon:yes stop_codon:yes gene_type:complete
MTKAQYEIFMTYSGMQMEGLKHTEAMAALVYMKYATDDIIWLVKQTKQKIS